MNVSQALNNFCFLKHLSSSYKLITDGVGFSYDDRWLPSVRRTVTRNSRRDLLKPIEQTFVLLREIINPLEELNVLKHIQEVFQSIYPDYQAMHSLIARLIENSSLRVSGEGASDGEESAIESLSVGETGDTSATDDEIAEDFNMSSATITSTTRDELVVVENPLHAKCLPGITPDKGEVFEPPTFKATDEAAEDEDDDDSWVTSSYKWCCASTRARLRKKVKNI